MKAAAQLHGTAAATNFQPSAIVNMTLWEIYYWLAYTASVVVVCNTPRRRNVTHQGAARDGGSIVLRPVRGDTLFHSGMLEFWRQTDNRLPGVTH